MKKYILKADVFISANDSEEAISLINNNLNKLDLKHRITSIVDEGGEITHIEKGLKIRDL